MVWTLSNPHPHFLLNCISQLMLDRLNRSELPQGGRHFPPPGSSYLLLPPPRGQLPSQPGNLLLSSWASAHRGLLLRGASLLPHNGLGSSPGSEAPVFPQMVVLHPDGHVSLFPVSPRCGQGVASNAVTFSAHIWPSPHGPLQLDAPRARALARAPAFFSLPWPQSQADGSHPLCA